MNKLLQGFIELFNDLREVGLSDEEVISLLKKTKDGALTPEDLEILEKINNQ